MAGFEPLKIVLQDTDMFVFVVLPAPTGGASNQTYKLGTYDSRPCPQMNDRTKAVVRALLESALADLDRPASYPGGES